MADEAGNIGTALAEGTNARGYEGTPISNALQFAMQNELKKQAKEAELEARKQKRIEEAMQFKSYKSPIVHPALQSVARMTGNDLTQTLVGAIGDPLNTSLARQQGEQKLSELVSFNNQLEGLFKESQNPNLIVPKSIRNAGKAVTESQYEEAISKFDPIESAIYGNTWGVMDTPTKYKTVRTPTINQPLSKIDFMKWAEDTAGELVKNSFPKQGGVDANGKILIERNPTDDQIKKKAEELIFTPAGRASILSENYNFARQEIEKKINANPNISPDKAAEEVAKDMAINLLKTVKDKNYSYLGTLNEKKYGGSTQRNMENVDIGVRPFSYYSKVYPAFNGMQGDADYVSLPNAISVPVFDPSTNQYVDMKPLDLVRKPNGDYVIFGTTKKITTGTGAASVGGYEFDKAIELSSKNLADLKKSIGLSEGSSFQDAINDRAKSRGLSWTFDEKKYLKAPTKVIKITVDDFRKLPIGERSKYIRNADGTYTKK